MLNHRATGWDIAIVAVFIPRYITKNTPRRRILGQQPGPAATSLSTAQP